MMLAALLAAAERFGSYASILSAPHAGCRRLDVSSGRVRGSLVVQVVVQ
jgi:hypothetical protein